MPNFDLIIIGGGAAGLMAATSAIRAGRNVLLLEKNNKLGVKILMSGGTRCNITHACSSQEIIRAFGTSGKFLHSALAALQPHQVIELVEEQGVATKVEPGGKIFPASDRAIDVRDALVSLAADTNQPGQCKILTNHPCQNIQKIDDRFRVITDEGVFTSPKLLITTGGKSYPGCGTTGDGYGWAKLLGHKIIPPVPALTPILNSNYWTQKLKGTTFEHVRLKMIDRRNKTTIDQRNGGFLFTHFGYSGPAALDISRCIALSDNDEYLSLFCDFEPETNEDQLRTKLKQRLGEKPKQSLFNNLSRLYTKRFCESFLAFLQIDGEKRSAEVAKTDINKIVTHLKRLPLPISGVYGFKKAEVTAGGVSLSEIDSRTMQSKKCPGLYFAGEVLDVDGPIGGYNFQAAFSTAWLAGQQ